MYALAGGALATRANVPRLAHRAAYRALSTRLESAATASARSRNDGGYAGKQGDTGDGDAGDAGDASGGRGHRASGLGAIALVSTLGGSAYILLQKPVHAEGSYTTMASKSDPLSGLHLEPLSSLLRTYIVYLLCSSSTLVDCSPSILSTLLVIPGLGKVVEAFVRHTFFSQFVGGDTAEDTLSLLQSLRKQNKGVVLAYSVEVDERQSPASEKKIGLDSSVGSAVAHSLPHKLMVEEMVRSVDIAADFEDKRHAATGKEQANGRKTYIAVKMTALLPDVRTLIHLSEHLLRTRPPAALSVYYPGTPTIHDLDVLEQIPTSDSPLTAADISSLRELRDDLFRICRRAQERGVRVIIDAEYCVYQPAIDAIQLALMKEFNRLPDPGAETSISMLHLITRSAPSSHSESPFLGVASMLEHLLPLGWKRWISVRGDDEMMAANAPLASAVLSDVAGKTGNLNSVKFQPLVYGTFQAYLRRTQGHLAASFRIAEENGFALGVKLVRGAYHSQEIEVHRAALRLEEKRRSEDSSAERLRPQSQVQAPTSSSVTGHGPLPPVWLAKGETDACFNESARELIQRVAEDVRFERAGRCTSAVSGSAFPAFASSGAMLAPRIGLLFGTHNWRSCELILDELESTGLATRETPIRAQAQALVPSLMRDPTKVPSGSGSKVTDRDSIPPAALRIDPDVADRMGIAQLYGMSDALTDSLVARMRSSNPVIIKYVPYGALAEVMPYLSRRAIENKSVLGAGGAAAERARVYDEIVRRSRRWWKLLSGVDTTHTNYGQRQE